MKEFVKELIRIIKKQKPSKIQLSKIKTGLCKKHRLKKIPTDIEVLLNAPVKEIPNIKKYLLTKPTRTISGVAAVAVMTKPFPCPHAKKGIGPCSYCPGGVNSVFGSVPQSYTGKEPATRRAIRNKYNPYLQVFNRLEQYIVSGHVPDKIELIIMGGTFTSFPKKYRENFVKYSIKAMNDFSAIFFKNNKFNIIKFKEFFELPGDINNKKRIKRIQRKLLKILLDSKNHKGLEMSEMQSISEHTPKSSILDDSKNFQSKKQKGLSLEKIQKDNESSNIRNVALCIETRPDYAKLKQANEMLRLGCTRVELGVQTIYNDILKKVRRGHTVEDTIKATSILKDLGFKISYHIIPGLPSVNKKQDLFAFQILFADPDFRPDMLKIYPCMVLRGTKLYNLWKKGKYKPLTTKQAANLITEFKKYVAPWVRISRVQRDIPTFMTEAGVDMTNLRQYIQKELKKKKIKCRCIRCREAGHVLKQKNIKTKKIEILVRHYEASNGSEFFISAEDRKNDILFGFCRLRVPSQFLRKEITEDSVLIRELHVFSPAVAIGKKSKTSYQHKGIGKRLLKEAENIAKSYFRKKVVVIAGIGARAYYKKFSYRKEGPYMVKYV